MALNMWKNMKILFCSSVFFVFWVFKPPGFSGGGRGTNSTKRELRRPKFYRFRQTFSFFPKQKSVLRPKSVKILTFPAQRRQLGDAAWWLRPRQRLRPRRLRLNDGKLVIAAWWLRPRQLGDCGLVASTTATATTTTAAAQRRRPLRRWRW